MVKGGKRLKEPKICKTLRDCTWLRHGMSSVMRWTNRQRGQDTDQPSYQVKFRLIGEARGNHWMFLT